jgi:hypothetical protein
MRLNPYIYIILITTVSLFAACKNFKTNGSSRDQTPEIFAGNLLEVLKHKDENALFNLFIQKAQLEEVMQLIYHQEAERQTIVDEMWAAINEDKGNMVRKFQRGGIGDFKLVTLDSVSSIIEPLNSFAGYESRQQSDLQQMVIKMYMSQNSQSTQLSMRCIKFGNGEIKMVDYPNF